MGFGEMGSAVIGMGARAFGDAAAEPGYREAYRQYLENLRQYGQGDELVPSFDELQAQQLGTGFDNLNEDPRLREQQMRILDALMGEYASGGMTPESQAEYQRAQDMASRMAGGRAASAQQGLSQRGLGNSGLALAAQLQANQDANQTAGNMGVQSAGNARLRALQALEQAGNQSGHMRDQDYRKMSDRAAAQDAINKFNAQFERQRVMTNNGMRQQGFDDKMGLRRARAGAREGVAGQAKQSGDRAMASAADWGKGMQDFWGGASSLGGGGF